MKDLLNRIVFHPEHGYGMIMSDDLSMRGKILIRYEDKFAASYYPTESSLVILPRFGEKIKVWDNRDEWWLEEYRGYVPKCYSPVQTGENSYKHFTFIDEPEPIPGKATEQVIDALRVLNEYFKED
jgi:hypothetical protein